MANEVEKITSDVAQNNVAQADAKVEQIKAEKAAKKAERQAKRVEKHPRLGKILNKIEDNAIPVGIGIGIGGPLGVAAVLGYQKYKSSKADTTDDVIEEEAVEPPFDAEV